MNRYMRAINTVQAAVLVTLGAVYPGAVSAGQVDWTDAVQQTGTAAENASAEVAGNGALERPDFSGTWVLDRAVSDDPEVVMRSARTQRRKASFNRNGSEDGPGAGRGPGGGGRRPATGGADPGTVKARPQSVSLAEQRLVIRHTEPELVVSSGAGAEQTIFTDFRGVTVSAMHSATREIVIAGWENDELVIEIRKDSRAAVVQRLRILEDPPRLERVTEIPAPGSEKESIQIRQVFNRQDS